MKQRIVSIAALVAVSLVAFTATAFAAGVAAPSDGSWLDLARPVVDAVMSGNYLAASALALVLVVAAARKYGASRWAFLGTDAGGSLLVLLGAFGGAVASAALGGASWSLDLLWTALKVAAGAAGGYSLIKRLLLPLVEKLPPWLSWVAYPLQLVLWVFESRGKAATAAGERALRAKPSTGIEGVTGKPRDLR
jgi:hypothetical protein